MTHRAPDLLRIALFGARGRMGSAIAAAAERAEGLTITGKIDRDDSFSPALENCDVLIDFSTAEATEEVCRACVGHAKPLVLGTTGQTDSQKQAIATAAAKIPIVFAANFSLGVNLLFRLAREAAESLGSDFDVEIVEMHHRTKKDAPSGTARRLAEILREVRSPEGEISVHALRAGDVVGDHQVVFAGPGERLELIHRASSRETFAMGALRAARWLVNRPAGLYSMENVLGRA